MPLFCRSRCRFYMVSHHTVAGRRTVGEDAAAADDDLEDVEDLEDAED
jgi:hypothetical protein